MASFNLLKLQPLQAEKANGLDYQAAPEWNWELSKANGSKKKCK